MTGKINKICVVGPGAIGCLFAAHLAEGGHNVFLLDKNHERAGLISRKGITVERENKKRVVKVQAAANAEIIGVCDIVLIAVKSYDTESAVKHALPLSGKKSIFLTLQNGLGNEYKIASVVGKEKTIAGTTAHGANVLSSGSIIHAGIGDTYIGELSGRLTVRVKKIAEIFSSCKINTSPVTNINSRIWGKLVLNAGINPLTVLLNCRNGELLNRPESKELMRLLVEEAAAVAKKKKIRLPYPDAFAQTQKVAFLTGANISSMLQDVRKGKKTEIDYINGAVVREGKNENSPTPFNQFATLLVKIAQDKKR
ncbi:MAG: 2-dehydropantoate 2-reductase [Planctomycetota bacterium]